MGEHWWMDHSIWPPLCFLCLLGGIIFGMLIGNIQGQKTAKERAKKACERLGKILCRGSYVSVDVGIIKGLWPWLKFRMEHDVIDDI